MLLAIDFTNLHEILQALYQDMMPLCEKLTERGISADLPCHLDGGCHFHFIFWK